VNTPEQAPKTDSHAFGTELRRLREEAGLTLDEIIADTKISRRILEALESGRFQYLPERVFCKNFVRQYARNVGAGEEALVRLFDLAWESFVLSSGSHPSLVVPADQDVPRRRVHWHFWIPVGIGVVVVGVIVAMVLHGAGDSQLMPSTAGQPTFAPRPTRLPTVSPSPTAAAAVAAEDQAAGPRGSETLEIEVSVPESQECWVHFRDSNGHTGQQLVTAGGRLQLVLAGPILLTLGNAGAAVLEVDGTEHVGLGLPGQVLHIEISDSGLRFLGSGARRE
jgi:cytoskeletal protein RodZ